ncbi:MAG: DNA-binding protein [uncultured bacterium]|nr:MAG: DNA-binding protein [uncultured bacterium]
MKKSIKSSKRRAFQKKSKKSDILAVVHETAKSLYDSDLMDVKTMHSFDVMCLPSVRNLTAKEIKKIRLREKLSQPVFAGYLNASASTVKKWETGEKHPTGPALKLLNLIADKGLNVLV